MLFKNALIENSAEARDIRVENGVIREIGHLEENQAEQV